MGKPTEEELNQALAEAARMREQGEDPHHVAKALLNLNYRLEFLERVLHSADKYLRYGQEESEHRELTLAIKKAREAEAASSGAHDSDIGLS